MRGRSNHIYGVRRPPGSPFRGNRSSSSCGTAATRRPIRRRISSFEAKVSELEEKRSTIFRSLSPNAAPGTHQDSETSPNVRAAEANPDAWISDLFRRLDVALRLPSSAVALLHGIVAVAVLNDADDGDLSKLCKELLQSVEFEKTSGFFHFFGFGPLEVPKREFRRAMEAATKSKLKHGDKNARLSIRLIESTKEACETIQAAWTQWNRVAASAFRRKMRLGAAQHVKRVESLCLKISYIIPRDRCTVMPKRSFEHRHRKLTAPKAPENEKDGVNDAVSPRRVRGLLRSAVEYVEQRRRVLMARLDEEERRNIQEAEAQRSIQKAEERKEVSKEPDSKEMDKRAPATERKERACKQLQSQVAALCGRINKRKKAEEKKRRLKLLKWEKIRAQKSIVEERRLRNQKTEKRILCCRKWGRLARKLLSKARELAIEESKRFMHICDLEMLADTISSAGLRAALRIAGAYRIDTYHSPPPMPTPIPPAMHSDEVIARTSPIVAKRAGDRAQRRPKAKKKKSVFRIVPQWVRNAERRVQAIRAKVPQTPHHASRRSKTKQSLQQKTPAHPSSDIVEFFRSLSSKPGRTLVHHCIQQHENSDAGGAMPKPKPPPKRKRINLSRFL